MKKRSIVPIIYILFLLLPIYWLVAMSFKTTNEILGGFSLFPQTFTLENYKVIFTDPTWYWGYINSISYVTLNTVISITLRQAFVAKVVSQATSGLAAFPWTQTDSNVIERVLCSLLWKFCWGNIVSQG